MKQSIITHWQQPSGTNTRTDYSRHGITRPVLEYATSILWSIIVFTTNKARSNKKITTSHITTRTPLSYKHTTNQQPNKRNNLHATTTNTINTWKHQEARHIWTHQTIPKTHAYSHSHIQAAPSINTSEILPIKAYRHTPAGTGSNKSPFIQSYLHKADDL